MILKWSEFIKESKSEEKEIWKLDEDEILELFYGVTDEGYVVEVEFGFIINGGFSEIMLSGEYKVAYFIRIIETEKVTNTNIVGDIQTAYNILSDDFDIKTQDSGGSVDISSLSKESPGLYINDMDGNEVGQVEDYFSLIVSEKEYTKFSDMDLVNYYNWKGYTERDGKIFVEISLTDMISILLSRKSDYIDILENGTENMWDNYYNSDYQPDIQSMFDYSLTNENSHLLVKSIIKEVGGLTNFINHIGDECSDASYEYVKDKSEDEVIKYLLKERYFESLKKLCAGSEISREIKQTIGDWEMNAHVDRNYEEVLDSFDKVVSDEFTYRKIEKEEIKINTSKDGKVTEYKEIVTYYEIPFNNKWIESETERFLKSDLLLSSIFIDWGDNENFGYSLKPYFSDYGNVNKKALNSEITSDLERYLNK